MSFALTPLRPSSRHWHSRFVGEEVAEARYAFLIFPEVPYALSFANWSVRSHDDPARSYCYFHRKMYKPDIIASMKSGRICDECRDAFDSPPAGSGLRHLTAEEHNALEKMRLYVAGDHPHALVMKGGGVKGLALAGALMELEKHFGFDRHVGTSAGAIAAVLLSAGFKPAELRDLFINKDFTDFLDAPLWKLPFNLIFRSGFYPGEVFRIWIGDLLSQKLRKIAPVEMQHLKGALIYAGSAGRGTITYGSKETPTTLASFAVRCSMSIPFLFTPMRDGGRRVFDGGVRNNFPLRQFLATHGEDAPFVGIYLGKPENGGDRSVIGELVDIAVANEERQLVDRHRRNTVVIDTTPISTIDFRLTDEEKDFLIMIGRASALEFLLKRNPDDGPSIGDVQRMRAKAERARTAVVLRRTLRRKRRKCIVLSVAAAVVVVLSLWLIVL